MNAPTAAIPTTPDPSDSGLHPSSELSPDPSPPSPSLLLNPAFHASAAVTSCVPPGPNPPSPASSAFLDELNALTDAISAGDYQHPEALAASQATALNAMFARIASVAMGDMQHPHFDSLIKLAFRAQDLSCRALNTLNTLVDSSGSYYRQNHLERKQAQAKRKAEAQVQPQHAPTRHRSD